MRFLGCSFLAWFLESYFAWDSGGCPLRRYAARGVKTQMAEMIETGESPYNSRHTCKSVVSFLDSQGPELNIRAEDLPRGKHDNQLALPKEVREEIERSCRKWLMFFPP